MSESLDVELTLQDIDVHVTNLPFAATSLVGRQKEVAQLAVLLQRNEVRLVTLTGAGGTGKTRLALRVAGTLFKHFVDGIYFVDLSPIQTAEFVLPTIIHTLVLTENGTTSALDTLKHYLRTKRVLLVLDNFEHLTDAAPLVAALLAVSITLKVLVTSRSSLHLSGEYEFPVFPLAVPNLLQLPDVKVLTQNPSVALFIERAQAVKPDFQLTSSNATSIAEICVRLDGLPLAIELAATRCKMLSPQALLTKLSQPFLLLTGGARDLPARQQTLRATIEWSYKLLDEQEQQLFRRLAVFVGGGTLETIAIICYEQIDESPIDSFSVFEHLTALVEKSLLVRVEQEDGEARFKFLQLVRDYAKECLEASGETEHFRQRHLNYYLALAETAEPKLTSHEQLVWLLRLEQEHDNLRAALAACRILPDRAELGLRLASSLWQFWSIRGYVDDWNKWLELFLAETLVNIDHDRGSRIRFNALYRMALLLIRWGKFAKAEELAKEILQSANIVGDLSSLGCAYYVLGKIAISSGVYQEAQSYLEDGLQHFHILNDRQGICGTLLALSWIAETEHDYSGAIRYCQDALIVAHTMGDRLSIANGLYSLGMIALAQERFEESDRFLNEALQWHSLCDSPWLTVIRSALAHNALRKNDYNVALVGYTESLILAEELRQLHVIAYPLAGLAAIVNAYGHSFLCVQIFGCANAYGVDFTVKVDPGEHAYYREILAVIRAELGEKTFAEAWDAGLSLTSAEVLVLVNTAVIQSLTSAPVEKLPETIKLPAGLSEREADVLRLLAQGLTNIEMAEKLIISPFTINAHLRNIYNKIGTSVRREAIGFARQHNLV